MERSNLMEMYGFAQIWIAPPNIVQDYRMKRGKVGKVGFKPLDFEVPRIGGFSGSIEVGTLLCLQQKEGTRCLRESNVAFEIHHLYAAKFPSFTPISIQKKGMSHGHV